MDKNSAVLENAQSLYVLYDNSWMSEQICFLGSPFLTGNMGRTKGYRMGTRHMFSRDFRAKGPEHLSTYLQVYKVGDIVDVKANGSIHKGMPHKFYHGKTGVVYNVTKRAVGVTMNKRVGYVSIFPSFSLVVIDYWYVD